MSGWETWYSVLQRCKFANTLDSLVYCHFPPQSADEYVHRIGRTGRMGNTGRASSFYDSDADGAISRDLVKILADAQQVRPNA